MPSRLDESEALELVEFDPNVDSKMHIGATTTYLDVTFNCTY